MKYFIKELNKSFETKEELFAALHENKKVLLDAKKSEIKMKRNCGFFGFLDSKTGTVKALPNMEDDFIYPIISNTMYLDSHDDVHMNGSMTKTVKEQQGKIYYVADHKLLIDNIIATPKNVEMYVQKIKWSDIGRSYDGETEVLVFKIHRDNIKHEKFKDLIDDGEELENSIRMLYINLDFAYNTNEKNYVKEKANWDEIAPKIANQEALENKNYFYVVRELKIWKEGSSVLFGSNDATSVESTKNIEAVLDTSKHEPSNDTQKTNYFNTLFNN